MISFMTCFTVDDSQERTPTQSNTYYYYPLIPLNGLGIMVEIMSCNDFTATWRFGNEMKLFLLRLSCVLRLGWRVFMS